MSYPSYPGINPVLPDTPVGGWSESADPVKEQLLQSWTDANGTRTLWHVKVHDSSWQTWFLGDRFHLFS